MTCQRAVKKKVSVGSVELYCIFSRIELGSQCSHIIIKSRCNHPRKSLSQVQCSGRPRFYKKLRFWTDLLYLTFVHITKIHLHYLNSYLSKFHLELHLNQKISKIVSIFTKCNRKEIQCSGVGANINLVSLYPKSDRKELQRSGEGASSA